MRQRIGTTADFPIKELARKEAERLLKPINEDVQKPESVQTLCQFGDETFLPFWQKQVRPSTFSGYCARWRQVRPWCAELRMRDTRTADIQRVIEGIHSKGSLNHDSVRALRSLLKLIFDHAIRIGLLTLNPVDKAKVPPKSEAEENGDDTYAYSLEEVQGMLSVLPEPARTAVATAGFTGIRRGELAGLRWEDFDADKGSLTIARSLWEGHITRPKTKKSKAPVPVIRLLIRMLEAHRVRVAQARAESATKHADRLQTKLGKAGSMLPELRADLERQIAGLRSKSKDLTLPTTGPILATEKDTPLNMNNLLNRQILPALNRCATCHKPEAEHVCEGHEYKRDVSRPAWRGWHSFRRGLATNLKRLGVDLKTIQAILRHAHISVTADIYVKDVSEDSVAAMQKLEAHVIAELKKAARTGIGFSLLCRLYARRELECRSEAELKSLILKGLTW